MKVEIKDKGWLVFAFAIFGITCFLSGMAFGAAFDGFNLINNPAELKTYSKPLCYAVMFIGVMMAFFGISLLVSSIKGIEVKVNEDEYIANVIDEEIDRQIGHFKRSIDAEVLAAVNKTLNSVRNPETSVATEDASKGNDD